MLFAKVDKRGTASIKRVLDQFCVKLGQAISVDKSRIYFSSNTPNNLKDNIYETWAYKPPHALKNIWGSP